MVVISTIKRSFEKTITLLPFLSLCAIISWGKRLHTYGSHATKAANRRTDGRFNHAGTSARVRVCQFFVRSKDQSDPDLQVSSPAISLGGGS